MFQHRQSLIADWSDMTPSISTLALCIYCGEGCFVGAGKCHCGCNLSTPLASHNDKKSGWRKGFPLKRLYGHRKHYRGVNFDDATPFKIEGAYCKLIPLTQGQFSIVDVEDYTWIAKSDWYARFDKTTQSYYAVRQFTEKDLKQRTILMHREILKLGQVGDQRQGDHKYHLATLDNRRKNLRIVSPPEQAINHGRQRNNTSGYKGVSFHKVAGKWSAQIRINRKTRWLGLHATPELAYAAYCKGAGELHGEFACLT